MTRNGSLNLHDTSLHIWEEPINPAGSGLPKGYEAEFTEAVFVPLRGFFRRRGWIIERDPRGKDYKCIAKWMWQGRKGDLQVKLNLGGRHIAVEFFQNIVRENPAGGQYDFGRFSKMPYLIRISFLAEMTALIEHLQKRHRYSGPEFTGVDAKALPLRIARACRYGKNTLITEDPLRSFNDHWDDDWSRKNGRHRFQRDEDGWPTAKELGHYYAGFTPGCERFWINRSGYVMRGRAYPNMNGMCGFVYGPGARDCTYVNIGELLTAESVGCLRKKTHHRRKSVVKGLLDSAVKDQRFEKAIIYRNILAGAA